MNGQLPKLIDELLRYRESPVKDTRLFRKLRHNDHLCPAVEGQLNQAIDCFTKFHNIAYDVQGINDRGTDVLLRYDEETESGEPSQRYIAFQIKSFDDLNSKNYLRELKAQRFEAQTEFGGILEHYYILVCTDKLVHENRIRQIKKTFGPLGDVTVIDPAYTWTFIHLNPLRINAVVDSILREDDFVYKEARKMVESFTPTEISILLSIVYEQTVKQSSVINMEAIQERYFVKETFRKTPDYPRKYFFFSQEVSEFYGDFEDLDQEDIKDIQRAYGIKWVNGKFEPPKNRKRDFSIRFSEDFDALDGELFSIHAGAGEIELNSEYALPIKAVLLDAMVRYGYHDDNLLEYVFNALGVYDTITWI